MQPQVRIKNSKFDDDFYNPKQKTKKNYSANIIHFYVSDLLIQTIIQQLLFYVKKKNVFIIN